MKIQLNSAYMDFKVSKKKYESYKTDRGRNNYLKKTVNQYLSNCVGDYANGLHYRLLELESYNCTFSQLNESDTIGGLNLKFTDNHLIFRLFGVKIISVVLFEDYDKFPT